MFDTYLSHRADRNYRFWATLGLLWTLLRTDFKTRYHGTLGGYFWALLKPVGMFLVLLGVFANFMSMDKNYAINLIIGLFLFEFFSEATRAGLAGLHSKAYLVTKTTFPKWVLVVTSCSNAVITLVLFGAVLTVYVSLFRHSVRIAHLGLLLGYILSFIVIVIGLSLFLSVVFLRLRDLNQIWDMVLQAGFFIAPIIYPLNIVPERFHILLYFWFPTPIIQFFREVLVQETVPSIRAHVLLASFALATLCVGGLIFWRLGPRAIEEL